jgi:ABC-type bacteriocin/lantibiotic exporter with double-glycine peptidase domain
MGLVVAASLVQSVTRSPLYALIGVGLGVAIAAWGALTRVRRRLFGGVIAVVASLLLLIAVPLVPVVSHWGGVLVWLVLAAAGLAAITAAALLDTTRSAIRREMTRLSDLTHDWE